MSAEGRKFTAFMCRMIGEAGYGAGSVPDVEGKELLEAALAAARADEREQAAKRIEYHLKHGYPVSDQCGAYSYAAKIVRESERPVEPSQRPQLGENIIIHESLDRSDLRAIEPNEAQ